MHLTEDDLGVIADDLEKHYDKGVRKALREIPPDDGRERSTKDIIQVLGDSANIAMALYVLRPAINDFLESSAQTSLSVADKVTALRQHLYDTYVRPAKSHSARAQAIIEAILKYLALKS